MPNKDTETSILYEYRLMAATCLKHLRLHQPPPVSVPRRQEFCLLDGRARRNSM
jgi:hypothetical protein